MSEFAEASDKGNGRSDDHRSETDWIDLRKIGPLEFDVRGERPSGFTMTRSAQTAPIQAIYTFENLVQKGESAEFRQ
ncbi:hypothetical protein [Amycolatopsis sp. NPDC051071]|uniref:hypothetical protein n=1 Tax=Amycolatopsis sp. NPDC051071 TaxID=3154637 RepID=UPI00341BDA87